MESPTRGQSGRGALPCPTEVAQFQLTGQRCRVLCVDDVVPHHTKSRQGSRPRLLYAEAEVAHFELGGHMYAIVVDGRGAAPEFDLDGVPPDIRDLLTQRELQIVQLLSMGSPTKRVADALGISEFTVRSYLKTIYCKLGVRSRGAMAYRYAQAFQRVRLVGASGTTAAGANGSAASKQG